MVAPPLLKKGDTVGILAPSSALRQDNLDYASGLLSQWGLKVQYGKSLYSKYGDLAGTDEQRTQDLQEMLDSPTVKAIFCARGGYGASRIMDRLNFTLFTKNPKWIIGFSDITALHFQIQVLGFQSIHAAMPTQFEHFSTLESLRSLQSALFEKSSTIEAKAHSLNRPGVSEGVLVGGNLSLIDHMIGTASDIDFADKILFIEEVNEPLYRMDRMMLHLSRAGKLRNLKGLVIGDMDVANYSEDKFAEGIEEIVLGKVGDYHYPLAFNFPIGHQRENRAVCFGSEATLDVSNEGAQLRF